MSGNDWETTVRSLAALATAVGGLWAVLRMALSYQRDFTDRYAVRVQHQDDRIDALEAEIDGLHKQVIECGQREARMRLALIAAGIEVPPSP